MTAIIIYDMIIISTGGNNYEKTQHNYMQSYKNLNRHGITYDKAKQLVTECRDALLEAPSTTLSDDIIASYLGLEPDYIFDILDM